MPPDCYCVCHNPLSSRPVCEHCDGATAIQQSLLSLPGIKQVEIGNVLHISIIVDETSEEQRRVIYEQELRLIEAYPDIELDFNLCRE